MEKIATITVTYNRKDLLIKNIESILNQTYKVDSIIIIDNNSSDNSKEIILEKFKDSAINITYIYLDENIGGAGGFYTGCKFAFEKGYDWVLLMDDDGKTKNTKTIENLVNELKNKNLTCKDKVMLNSLVLCDDKKLSFGFPKEEKFIEDVIKNSNENIYKNYVTPFNSTLISSALIEEIGFPNKDFFIKGDERDYFARAQRANAYIATVVNSLYYHPRFVENNLKELKFFGKKYKFFIENAWKEYYRVRNYTYTYMRENKNREAIRLLVKKLISAIICKCNKIETIKLVIKGYNDGKKGKLGNTVKPNNK